MSSTRAERGLRSPRSKFLCVRGRMTRASFAIARFEAGRLAARVVHESRDGRIVDPDEGIRRHHCVVRRGRAGVCLAALAIARSGALRVLPGSRGAGFGTQGATARHRRHHVGELFIHPAGRAGTEPSRDTADRLHGNSGAERVASTQATGSGQSPVQRGRHDGECQRAHLSHAITGSPRGSDRTSRCC